MSSDLLNKVGIVVIGRNEGERLERCLTSLKQHVSRTVYVDSGSTDNSVSFAKHIGCAVVELDMSIPFTAARARNAGVELLARDDSIEYIQFVDGDCEMEPNWLDCAVNHLESNTEVACVAGVLQEKHKDRSIYNLLCAMEWNTPTGIVNTTGGIFMCRANIFHQVGGFNDSLICGEEPDLCFRIREIGFKIGKIQNSMAFHDANMLHFKQWWLRTKRSGFAYASAAQLRNKSLLVCDKVLNILLWGIISPLLIVLANLLFPLYGLYILAVYPIQIIRIFLNLKRQRKESKKELFIYACFLVLGKLPESTGVLSFILQNYTQKKVKILEYK